MKHLKIFAILLLVQFSFVQCQTKQEVITYEVTPEFSKKIDKPEVHFTADIPKNLTLEKPEEGKKNYSYGMIQKINDNGVVVEMCSFGYITLDGMALEKEGKSFLAQIRDMLKAGGYAIEEDTIGMIEFDGKEYLSLNAIGKMEDGISEEFKGRYYFNVIAKPNPYGNTHILLLMAARDDQGITSYKEFKDKLDIATVWKTFEYKK